MVDFTKKYRSGTGALRKLAFAVCLLFSTATYAQIPIASFSADSTEGCAPLTVHFSNSSILATNYFWIFGNGNTSVLPNPTTVYLSSGYYTVTLIAYNSNSNKSDTLSITNYIHTVDYPTANFSGTPLSGCAGSTTVSFTNTSSNATNYIWDFGDGTSSTTTNPVHTYNNAGLYTVKLIAYTAFGCNHVITKPSYITVRPLPVAAVNVNLTSTCNPNQVFSFSCPSAGITSYQWNFGQPSSGANNTSTLATPTHTYGTSGTYTVTLIVQNQYGCADTIVMNNYISIGSTLVPSFTVSDSSGCDPFNTTFTSTVPGATSYLWNFGDPSSGASNTSIAQSQSHTYNTPGTYNISLTVTTTSGCNGSVTKTALVTVDNLPTANFNLVNGNTCAPATVQFTNSSTGAAGGYLWEFGDGNTSTLATPSNIYTSPGVYTVTLHAYSLNGCEATIVKTNFVTINGAQANFTGTPQQGCAPLQVSFIPTVLTGISSYQWNFGDPASGASNTSSLQYPTHTYNALGLYTVQFIITTTNGCKDTIVKTNYLNVAASSVTYTLPDTIEGCQPFSVSFTDPLTGSSSWHWDFGVSWLTDDTSNVKNPTYTYDSAGVYIVNLTSNMQGNNGAGCSQSFQPAAIINVFPLVISPITYVVATPCSPFTVHFSDTTGDVVLWMWDFGDGSPIDSNQFPTHIYQQPGTYAVTLMIQTIMGCMTSISTTITLGVPNPILISKHIACDTDTLQFTLGSASQFSSWTWNFGDLSPTTNQQNPTHSYGQGGTFVITLNATTVTGCNYTYHDTVTTENIVASFVVNGLTEKCNSLYATFTNTSVGAVSYFWNFDDPATLADTSTDVSPTYFFHELGQYDITLTAYGQSCVKTVTYPAFIIINRALPDFSFTQASNCFPMAVQFTDLTNPVGVSWNWNFGDGGTSTVQHPVHTYYAPPTGNVSLNLTDTNGCSGSKTKPNIFFLESHFATVDTGGCRPYTVSFTESSDSSAVSYEWFFGDGTTSTLQNPTHTYIQDSLYTVTLVTTFASGCKDTLTMPGLINVTSPHANFNSSVQSGCAPVLAQFNNTSTNSLNYFWDFGDGTTSTNISPSHVYNIPGYYTITLYAYNNGCSDTLTRVDYIYIPGTYSSFTLASTLNCLGNYTCFLDSSINATSWQWNFGDGYTDTVQNPCHLYADTGNYIVSLIAYDSLGCQSFYTFPTLIDVHPNAVADGTVSDTLGCNPHTVNFTETATYEASYVWHFGDGDTSTLANPSHTYLNAGIYYPYLVAYNVSGCSDTSQTIGPIYILQTPTAQFTPSNLSGCTTLNSLMINSSTDTVNVAFNWNFGNGTFSSSYSPLAVYPDSGLFNVTLIVTNEGMCSDTAMQQVQAFLTPTALATTTDTLGCSPYQVTFTNASIFSTNYEWHFGDNQTSTDPNPVHIYATGGTYAVYLIATNQFGCSDTFYFANPITVLQTPNAQFTASILTGCTPLNIQLNNQSTDTVNSAYNWNFGNTTFSNMENPLASYPDSGVFNIELIVTNANGCTDTATQIATVHLTPTAIASTNDTSGCSPYSVSFNNTSVFATQFSWNFGDGNSSSDSLPVHVYQSGGIYYPSMIATNQFGCSDTILFTQAITVNQTPAAQFATNVSSGCTPLLVTTINQTTDTLSPSYNWNFGNLQTSTLVNPTVTYTDSSVYTIELIVANANGCADTATQQVTVNLSPTAIASTTDTVGCSPYTVVFNNNSINADSYLWSFGDGQTSTDPSPFYSYTSGGNYQVTLIAFNNAGCSDTIVLPYLINVKQSPTVDFSVSQSAQCSGSIFSFQNLSTNTVNPIYNWTIGAVDTSSFENPNITLISPGFYTVSLTVTNDNGCADSLTQINFIQVYDTLPPAADPLLSVSVLNNTQTEITWANSAALDLGAYKVWRLDAATNNYINIYTDNNPVNGSFNPDSKYTDSGLNTLQNTYTYKVQTLDRCAYAMPLSMLLPHTTVNVTARAVGTDIEVEWTPYIGCAVNTYEINRVEVSNGSTVLIATVPGIQTTFTDTTLNCPIEYSYKITATDLCGNPYKSFSDTSIAVPENELELQQAIMSHSTVVQNNFVLTEWAEPLLEPGRVFSYNILRSKDTNSVNYSLIATVPANVHEFEDYDVDVMEQNYFYKIEVVNDCNLAGTPSTNSSSILLQSRWMYTHSSLWWTAYDKWDAGVDKYEIEKYNWTTGQWELVKTVPGAQTSSDVAE